MAFKDHFSNHPEVYKTARPTYPEAVFAWLAQTAPQTGLAIDLGTGNGQAAIGLAAFFDEVRATDASAQQVEHAEAHPKVKYSTALAQNMPASDEEVDLVLAAQAAHWFDLEATYAEVDRVLKSRGIFALLSYGVHRLEGPDSAAVQELLHHFYSVILDGYWAPERELLESGYASLDLPFEPVETPAFELRLDWSLGQILGYLTSWSATQKYIREVGANPINTLGEKLKLIVPDDARYDVIWPLGLRVRRKA